jgi:hypothetical protein
MSRVTRTTLDPKAVIAAAMHIRAEMPHLLWRQALLYAADEVMRGKVRSGARDVPTPADLELLEAELEGGALRGMVSDPRIDDDPEILDPEPELIELSGSLRPGRSLVLTVTLEPTDDELAGEGEISLYVVAADEHYVRQEPFRAPRRL